MAASVRKSGRGNSGQSITKTWLMRRSVLSFSSRSMAPMNSSVCRLPFISAPTLWSRASATACAAAAWLCSVGTNSSRRARAFVPPSIAHAFDPLRDTRPGNAYQRRDWLLPKHFPTQNRGKPHCPIGLHPSCTTVNRPACPVDLDNDPDYTTSH
jgi:hypothetical protein